MTQAQETLETDTSQQIESITEAQHDLKTETNTRFEILNRKQTNLESLYQKQDDSYTLLRTELKSLEDTYVNLHLDSWQERVNKLDTREQQKGKDLEAAIEDLQRTQHFQEAWIRELEFDFFMDLQEKEKKRLEQLHEGINITGNGTLISGTNMSLDFSTIPAVVRESPFDLYNISRNMSRSETCHDGTHRVCQLVFIYEDPCYRFYCPSLCQWNFNDCSNYEPLPASLQCPFANCTVSPVPPPPPQPATTHIIWILVCTIIWILVLGMLLF